MHALGRALQEADKVVSRGVVHESVQLLRLLGRAVFRVRTRCGARRRSAHGRCIDRRGR